jgi:hypothetical protein
MKKPIKLPNYNISDSNGNFTIIKTSKTTKQAIPKKDYGYTLEETDIMDDITKWIKESLFPFILNTNEKLLNETKGWEYLVALNFATLCVAILGKFALIPLTIATIWICFPIIYSQFNTDEE